MSWNDPAVRDYRKIEKRKIENQKIKKITIEDRKTKENVRVDHFLRINND